MKKTFSQKKSAFSLIELSIVLIVIGLLIAGITGGASLIKSSELRSVMGEARGYAVATNAFYTQYNNLPGDFGTSLGAPSVGTGITASGDYYGNANGQIQYCTTGCDADGVATGSEAGLAWQHLKFAGGIDTAPEFLGGATKQVVGTNLPSSKIKSGGWGIDYNSTSTQNVVVLTGSTSAAGTVDTNSLVNGTLVAVGIITPSDALSIDSKIDDGKADSGKVRGVATKDSSATDDCLASSAYDVTKTSKACALSYQIDVNS